MAGKNQNLSEQFLSRGGEMGALMRVKDWSKTPVGDISTWPQSLRTTLSIILNSKFPMFLWWGPELISFYNDAYRPSLGENGKHPDILGMPAEKAWPEIWTIIKPLIDQVLAGGEATWNEDALIPIYRNGKIEDVYWTFSYSPVYDEAGKVAGVLVTCSETTGKVNMLNKLADAVTEQKNAALKLAETEKKFRDTVKQAPVGIIILRGRNFLVETANETYLQIVDREEKDFVGKSLFEGLPEVKEFVEPILTEVLDTGISYHGIEFPVPIHRFGATESTYFNFVYQALREDDGSISGIIVVATEVTEQVNAKHALVESEKQFRRIVTQSPIAMTVFRGKDYVIEIANETLLKNIWRREASEVIGKKLFDVFPELLNQKFPDLLENVWLTGKPYKENEAPAYVDASDGRKLYYLDFEYAPLFEPDGSVSGLMVTVNDVTEKVEARLEIEEAERRFRLLADSMPQHVWTGDAGGNLNYFNLSVFEYSGLTPEQVSKDGWLQIVHPDDREENVRQWTDAITTGDNFLFEHRFRKHNGEYRWQLSRAIPQKDHNGKIQMWVGTSTDIHEQKTFAQELEQKVRERTKDLEHANQSLEKMNQELASFAYVSSHDLQEPLRKIQTFASRIIEKERDNLTDIGKDYFERMQHAARRMQSLIEDLLSYSRTNTKEKKFEVSDLNAVLKDVEHELEHALNEKQATVTAAPLPKLNIIPYQFRQLFSNIFTNAIKFSKKDTSLKITVSSGMVKGNKLEHANANPNASYWHIAIADNGIGFDPEYKERIFEVFQRLYARDEYPGTGIGLAICKRIVENHYGFITADGEPGKGATFNIYIPIS